MKKIILGLLGFCTLVSNVQAAKGAFYAGMNGNRSQWKVSQNYTFDASKVNNTANLNADWKASSWKFNGDFLAGFKVFNGAMYGAIEGWYNPFTQRARYSSTDVSYTTKLYARYGANIILGAQDRDWTLYGLAGLGKGKITSEMSYASGGIYSTRPGPVLQNNSFTENPTNYILGIGLMKTYMVKKLGRRMDLTVEYRHIQSKSSASLNDQFITFLNPIGTQKTVITSHTFTAGIKFHFLPFVF
jgi:hypothetical protein